METRGKTMQLKIVYFAFQKLRCGSKYMSLVERAVPGAPVIAHVYRNHKRSTPICYVEDDPEGVDLLTLELPTETFFPEITDFLKTNQVDRLYVCGQTGTGKSTFIRSYCEAFRQKYKKARICLFSNKDVDEILDDIVERMPCDEETLFETPYTMAYLASRSKTTLVIFDDIEDFPKDIRKEVTRLQGECLRCGRSNGIYTICVHHDPACGYETKGQLFECNMWVTFPKRSGRGVYDYLYDKKLKLRPDIKRFIMKEKSNYVCIKKDFPFSVVSDKYIILDNA